MLRIMKALRIEALAECPYLGTTSVLAAQSETGHNERPR
jgi:hypothetical protein